MIALVATYHCGACGESLVKDGKVWFHVDSERYITHQAEPIKDV